VGDYPNVIEYDPQFQFATACSARDAWLLNSQTSYLINIGELMQQLKELKKRIKLAL